jgi:hypothetical protein
VRKPAIAALLPLIVVAAGEPGPRTAGASVPIGEIQEFARRQGFEETRNFRHHSERQAHYRCYYTGRFELPASYEGLRLREGSEAGCSVDPARWDVFFYPIEAVASGEAPVTESLRQADPERTAMVVAHEDFHATVERLPGTLAEAASTLVGFVTAAGFALETQGASSPMYRNLARDTGLYLEKSRLIRAYHARLEDLYSDLRRRRLSARAAEERKRELFAALERECRSIGLPHSFSRCPAVLNNAGLAFDMTYANHYPLVHELHESLGADLPRTIQALKEALERRSLGERGLVEYLRLRIRAARSYSGSR